MKSPLFTAVIAVYGVEQYLDAFLVSLDWQTISPTEIEYIFVDDCSPDGASEKIAKWAESKTNVKFVRNSFNSGAAEARKSGYAIASGTWITSVDPDDVLDKDYFKNVQAFIEDCGEQRIDLITTRVLPFVDNVGQPQDNHPLGFKYRHGDRLVSLIDSPSTIQLGATAFVKRAIVSRMDATFDSRVRPTFEDGSFLANYLLHQKEPIVGLVSSSLYYYRKRSSGESLVQSGWKKPEKYDDQLVYGYLPVLQRAMYKQGRVPNWLQYTVLYDLSWYFTEDLKQFASTEQLHHDRELAQKFIENLKQVFSYLDSDAVEKFAVRNIPWNIRQTWLVYFFENRYGKACLTRWRKGDVSSFSIVTREDPEESLDIYLDGKKVSPELTKVSRHYFGHRLTYETYFKVNGANVSVKYQGRYVVPHEPEKKEPLVELSDKLKVAGKRTVARGRVSKKERALVLAQVGSTASGKSLARASSEIAASRFLKVFDQKKKYVSRPFQQAIHKLSRTSVMKEMYSNAWLIMDRPMSANDNGEHFYRWLKDARPEVNSFFVLSKKSTAWDQLDAEGFRLIDYGSLSNYMAFLNAEVVVSSDAVAEVMYHLPREVFGAVRKPFVFLQHGVTRNDLSTWLNPKKIDLTIATTPDEYEYFASPEGPYTMSREQVALTGVSRFDRLYRLLKERKPSDVVRVTIMPTWRGEIQQHLSTLSSENEIRDYVFSTGLAKHWRSVLSNKRLLELVDEGLVEIAFVAHPNLAEIYPMFGFPDQVKAKAIKDIDFQMLLVESDVFISDYSSTAFDAAIAGCSIAYFQFDRAEFYSGAHTQRPGYFDEGRDGFGPLFTQESELLDWLLNEILESENSSPTDDVYQSRKSRLIQTLDGKARERTFDAIQEMLKRTQT